MGSGIWSNIEIWTNKFLKQFVSNVPLFILEYSDSVGELGCSWKRVKWGGRGGLRGPQRLTQSDWEIRFEPGCYGFGPGCRSAWDFGGIWCGGEEEHTAGDNESLSIELFWWLEFGRWLGNWGAGGDWVDKASIGLGSSGELEKNVKFTFEVTWPSREGLPSPRGFLVFGVKLNKRWAYFQGTRNLEIQWDVWFYVLFFMLGVCLRGAICSFWVAFMAWIVKNVLFHSVVYFSVHGQEQNKQMWKRLPCVGRGSLAEAI